jgi:hypothetical protein
MVIVASDIPIYYIKTILADFSTYFISKLQAVLESTKGNSREPSNINIDK